jgi:hypothetical protein
VKAFVVYESHWGNTAAIARAIAEGIGPEARALTTDAASGDAIAGADLIVAGAPVLAFRLPSEKMLGSIAADASMGGAVPPDLSHPSMHAWLESLPHGQGRSASFETRIRFTPGGATGAIDRGLQGAGYRPIAKGGRFIVKGKYGPLRDGEVERARAWGGELALAMIAAH